MSTDSATSEPAAAIPGSVRAAVVDRQGALPRIGSIELAERREGMTVVRVLAAALNPLELGLAAGVVPGFQYDRPYVPGIECTGVVVESDRFAVGDLVYASCRPSPDTPGGFADYSVFGDDTLVPLTEGVDPVPAVAAGNAGVCAYSSLIDVAGLREGESVMILGATGAVGKIAVQVCREYGAGHIIAVGRDRQALDRAQELGAHATVRLQPDETASDLAGRLAAAGDSANVVLDGLYGAPLEAALQACAPRARLVNVGNSAGPVAAVPAGLLRAKQLTLTAFAGFIMPLESRRPALEWLWSAISKDHVTVDVDVRPLDDLLIAWADQAASPHAKIVITPGEQPARVTPGPGAGGSRSPR